MHGAEDMSQRLARHVYYLAQEIGERNVWKPAALQAAADYIRSQWADQGYVIYEQAYEVGDVRCVNLEVATSTDCMAPMILVGAHYDSVCGSPGANDNGSGVAVLLELSRFFGGMRGAHIRFVAFVNEEAPFFATALQGSEIYAERARRDGWNIELMIALETLGYYSAEPGSQAYPSLLRLFYPGRGDFLAMVSNLSSLSKLWRFVKAFRESTNFPVEYLASPPFLAGVSWSDHRAFWQQGYPAIMVTDTAPYRYPYYHTPLDTAERVCCAELADVALGLAGAIKRLSERVTRRES
jgi:Zn-dependent M28 family amino/carboxypeptidase